MNASGLALAVLLLFSALWAAAPPAEAPGELKRAVDRLLTALQKADEAAIVALLRTPGAYTAGGALSPEARSHLFDRPQPYARSIAELARDWGIQSEIRMLANGSAVALFHTWGTKVEHLRDDDFRVSYFVCRFSPTSAGWRLERLCTE